MAAIAVLILGKLSLRSPQKALPEMPPNAHKKFSMVSKFALQTHVLFQRKEKVTWF
jgi:hypothetical protein